MKKLLLLFLVLVYPAVGFSAIDECKTDIYYANGILAEEEDVRLNTLDLLSPSIESYIYGTEEEMKKHIGEVGYSYNQTSGNMPQDGWETYMQKFGVQGFIDLWLALKGYITTHLEDVEEHIQKYSNRINLGHKVLVIAHSQGNLFTNEIYKALGKRSENSWMQDYFGAVSVASPMKADIKDDTVRITWDNDGVGRLIAHNGSVDPDEVTNPIRSVKWEGSLDYSSFDVTAKVIPTPYARQTQIGKVIGVGNQQFGYLGHKAIENGLDLAFNVHAFTYYMGKSLSRDVEIDIPLVPFADGTIVKKEFKDPFDENKTLQTNRAKDLIVSAIKDQLDVLDKVDSQWIKDQEFEKDTCDYKVTVKHQHDPSLEIGEKVYPFNLDKKLYQVNGEYVKASCGGENILETWDGKQDNECLMIDNPQKEKIFAQNKKLISTLDCTLLIQNKYRNGLSANMKNGDVWISCIGESSHYYAPERRDYVSWDDFLDAAHSFIMSKYEESDKKIRAALDNMKRNANDKYGDNITFKEHITLWSHGSSGWIKPVLYLNSSFLSVFCGRNDLREKYYPGCYKSYRLEIYK